MVERAVGAQLAHGYAVLDSPSGTPPFMSSRRETEMVVLLLLLYGVSRFCVWCSRLGADLLFFVSAWLRITVQLLHSLEGPPISRLSAPLSLPCAYAAFPLSPCFMCTDMLRLGSFCAVNSFLFFRMML